MAFGGYNPTGASELPFSNPNNSARSRTSSVSSVHSTSQQQPSSQQNQQQSPYHSPYGSRPSTPVAGSTPSAPPGYGAGGYDGYGSGSSVPASPASYHGSFGQHDASGGAIGVSSAVPFYGADSPSFHHRHSRTHSNASETSLNIDTAPGDGTYSPGPASLSSASSSRRGSFSDSGHSGGFFSRKKVGKTFRPEPHQSPEDYAASNSHADLDDDAKQKKARGSDKNDRARGRINLKKGMNNLFNDWDLLLPSADQYEGEDEDDGMNADERWKRKQISKRGWDSFKGQAVLIILLTAMAVIVRIWKLALPAAVVFDEQHFGGFTADYIKGEFFMDVHPPLGKMLYAAIAYMLGFDGSFSFGVGFPYAKNVPYIGMRMFAATCGVVLVPISYLIVKRSGHSTQAATLGAILVTFDNALITQSRFILLDAPMLLFMGFTMLSWIRFYNYRNQPFTRGWWYWLTTTGFALFLSISVKWVGLFTVTTIGLCVLKYLQESRTHLYISTRDFSRQFLALFLCLFVMPTALYVGLHVIDFRILSKSGSGNAWVSPQFQMTLKDHEVQPVMADIAWDSKIHIRHANTNGGLVHSMPGEYTRANSKDQAVQLVEWDDGLTCWQVFPADPELKEQHYVHKQERLADPRIQFQGYIYDGDRIRLRHCYTKVALSVNDAESIGSNKSFIREIRGVRWLKQPSPDTVWRVDLVAEGLVPGLADHHGAETKASNPQEKIEKSKGTSGVPPKVLDREMKDSSSATEQDKGSTKEAPVEPVPRDKNKQWHSIKGFRLWNEQLQCYLQSHKVFRGPHSTYQEVGCIQGGRQKANTIFVVDYNMNQHLPRGTASLSYQPLSFFQKFIELNRVMWWTHHDIVAPTNGNELHAEQLRLSALDSKPLGWPLMRRGVTYHSNPEMNHYIYLMGNPVLWWMATSAVLLYMSSRLWSTIKFLKGKQETKIERDRFGVTPFYAITSGTFFAGWAIHYIPFIFLSRQVHLHHYLPALYFSILLLVVRLDRLWSSWSRRARHLAALVIITSVILSWFTFSPLSYGIHFRSNGLCEQLKAFGRWDFACNTREMMRARAPPPSEMYTGDNEVYEEESQFYYHETENPEDDREEMMREEMERQAMIQRELEAQGRHEERSGPPQEMSVEMLQEQVRILQAQLEQQHRQ